MGPIVRKGQLLLVFDDEHYIFVGRFEKWEEDDILLMQLADQHDHAAGLVAAKFGILKSGLYDWAEAGIELKLTFKRSDRPAYWRRIQRHITVVLHVPSSNSPS